MNDASAYWSQLFEVVRPLRCWVRIAWREGDTTEEGIWDQLLTTPVEGYLEGSGWLGPLRDVQWVDVSMSYIKGGMAGRPLQILDDRKGEILAGLRGTRLDWELLDATWSVDRFFEDEPVQLARVMNPFFGPTQVRDQAE